MATTYAGLVTSLYAEIQNKSPESLTVLREAVLRQLRSLQSVRTLFMEETASFTLPLTAPHLGQYANSALSGFPADVMEIDTVWRVAGTAKVAIRGPFDISEVRTYTSGHYPFTSTVETGLPEIWAWFDDKLWVAPVLDTATAMGFDYFRDATRDTASGAELTTASTTQTNPWFDRGEAALRTAVLADYYSQGQFLDGAKAQAYLGQRNAYLADLKVERRQRLGGNRQAPLYL